MSRRDDRIDDTMIAPSGSPSPSLAPAPSGELQTIAGRYRLVRLVGAGGMGSVYEARDLELDETVALKVLRRELVDAPGALERFRREVKLARRVTHKNVARVFDIGEHAGEKFLTMELVDGESLGQIIDRQGRLAIGRAIEVAGEVCAGLAAAHQAGVIHRDLKPDNVMVARDGRIVITDFGIARGELEAGEHTGALAIVGTPAYMAPEQVEGGREIDARVDLYALGAMLFELLTGSRAWAGDSALAVAAARLVRPPPDPRAVRPDIPDALARAVMKCLARAREDRFASAAAVASELARMTLPQPSVASTPPPAPAPREPSLRSVAVLPFRNGGPPDDAYLAEGLTEDLIDTLSMTPGLRVCSRGLVQGRHADDDPRETGRALGVDQVVLGSVRRVGGAVRITARLVGVSDGFQLWAARFERPAQDVLAINDEVVQAVGRALTAGAQGTPPAPRAQGLDPIAVDLFLRGKSEHAKADPAAIGRALELYRQALERAPDDPTVLSAYAMASARQLFFSGAGEASARDAAERAIAAGPHLGEPWLARGSVRLQSRDLAGAVADARQAIGRNPALAEAHALLGRVLGEVGPLDEGIRRLERARELDPSIRRLVAELARGYILAGREADAEAALSAAPAVDAADMVLVRARLALWRRDAVAVMEHLRHQTGFAAPRVLFENAVQGLVPDDSVFDHLSSSASEGGARRRSFFLQLYAEVAAFAHDRERTLRGIELSVDAGLTDLQWLERCPLLDEIRADPRFAALRDRVAERAAAAVAAFHAP